MQEKTALPMPQLLAKALELQRSGQLEAAQSCCAQVLQIQPRHFDALLLAGVIAAQRREFDAAERLLARAVEANPRNPVALGNLGNVLKELGRLKAALARYEAAIALQPDYAQCQFNRAVALQEANRLDEAVVGYDRVLALTPDWAEAHGNRAAALASLGRFDAAVASYERAIALRPGDPHTHFALGLSLQALGRQEAAVASYDRTIALQPRHAAAHANRGAALQKLGQLEAAVASFDRAFEIDPGDAEVLYNRGVALQELAQPDAAQASYRAALRLRPDFAMARWAQAFVALKPVLSPGDDPGAARRAFGEAIGDLDRWFVGSTMDSAHEAVASRRPFYLSYQEADNRPLLSKYGALCHRLMSHWQQAQGIRPAAPSTAGRVRVGIVSSNICAHSVWDALVKGIVLHLDPGRFDLHVFHLGTGQDSETGLAQAKAASFVRGHRGLEDWTAEITRCRPEVLIYPEVGMHALTSQLASLRLAPVQAAMWGHPETTGLPTIDYFVSGDDLEPEDAQAFYTERLVRLPHLGCHYTRKQEPQGGAGADLPDLPGGGPLFVCPGTSFKYMPGHDWVYAEIARRVGSGRFVFFSQQPQWTRILEERLRAAFSAAGLDAGAHLVFLPWLPRHRFFRLMRRADVFLDTIGFSGFNTAMQAVECGLPIVTRRGRFMRGRLAAAILDRMGMEELVGRTEEDYVQLAVRLAGDQPYRQRVRQELLQRQQVLFEDLEPIRALERFLIGVCRPATTAAPSEAITRSPPAPETADEPGVH